jgi:hypothetical protein
MRAPVVLTATWDDGVFVCTGENRHHELAGQPVGALAPDGHGGALAIVSGRTLRRRAPDGGWITLATSEVQLSCCVSVGDVTYVGTDDARVLRVDDTGDIEPLRGFEAVAGRGSPPAISSRDVTSVQHSILVPSSRRLSRGPSI